VGNVLWKRSKKVEDNLFIKTTFSTALTKSENLSPQIFFSSTALSTVVHRERVGSRGI